MTVTTEETFKVDGTVLNTLAWNIQTLSGRSNTPPKVGENVRIPFRSGRTWIPKSYDQKHETLAMWVQGCTADGLIPAEGARAQFNTNLRALSRLFLPSQRQLQLERKLRYVSGLETHTAQAESAGVLEPVYAGPRMATFLVDLVMADPWWYGPTQNSVVTSAGLVINNLGDTEGTSMTLTFNGPLANPRLTNTSRAPSVYVQYTGILTAGQSVTLNVREYTAINQVGFNVIGLISHFGSLNWMELISGNNTMTLSDGVLGGSAGAGSVSVAFKPPYK